MDKALFNYSEYSDIIDSSFTKIIKHKNIFKKIIQKINFKKYTFNKKNAISENYQLLKEKYAFILPIQESARAEGGLKGEFQWLRLAELAKILKAHGPFNACELGGGASSAMFVNFLLEASRFTTVEESEYWQKRMVDAVGDLSKKMTLVRADRVLDMRDNESVTYYDIDHSQKYDCIYVDGPYSQPKEGETNLRIKDPNGSMPNIDVELFWEKGVFPKIIIIDGRRSTVRRLIQKSNAKYNIYLKSDFLAKVGLPVPSSYCYHTLMVLKEFK